MSYILVVENNHANARMMTQVLENMGFAVVHCERGMDAVRQARDSRPELVLMDFKLPDINGSVLILTMKKILGGIDAPPFIALTSQAADMERAVAKRYGYNAFINKPFEANEFLEMVLRFVQPDMNN